MTDGRRSASLLFPIIVGLFFASGATALIYQVAWLRSLILIFGSTAFAVATVLTTFMAGLAAGSYVVGRWIDRGGSPLVVYSFLEIGIGLYALAVPHLLEGLEPLFRGVWIGLEPPAYLFALVRFGLALAVLIAPTAMMGGTLPALARFAADGGRRLVSSVGGLYGANTLGALLGTTLSGFLLLPALGLTATLRLTAAANMAIGLIGLSLFLVTRWTAEPGTEPGRAESDGPPASGTAGVASPPRYIVVAFGLTGLAALALEVAWTRVLTLVIGPSVYAFALMLAAFLAGLGLGSVLFAGLIERLGWRGSGPFVVLSAASGVLALLTSLAFHRLPELYASLFREWGGLADPSARFGVELVVSGLVMLPPTLAMGGLFPAALAAAGLSRRTTGRSVGVLYAANSGGAIVGAFAGGFVLIPAFGLQGAVLAAAWVYLLVSAGLALLEREVGRRIWIASAAAMAAGAVIHATAPTWDRMLMSSGIYHHLLASDGALDTGRSEPSRPGYQVLFYEEGSVSTILVAREGDAYGRLGGDSVPSIFLVTDGKVDASSVADMPTQILSAHIPLLLHPGPRRAAVIGLASGTTAGSALRHELRSLDVIEIEPAVVRASHEFDFVNGRPLDDPRTRLTVADGRTFLLLGEERFDVIISEPSNPWMSGVANLFTREFFQLARERLKEDGVFAQWVQMYGLSPDNVKVLLRTFHSVFPHAYLFNTLPYTDLLLVGSVAPLAIDPLVLEDRLRRPAIGEDLLRIGVADAAALLAHGRLGPDELAGLVGFDGPLNTDDNAYIEFRAPLDLYRQTRGANERQIELAAAGLAPYLRSPRPDSLARFLDRLARAYEERGYRAEADWARQTASSMTQR